MATKVPVEPRGRPGVNIRSLPMVTVAELLWLYEKEHLTAREVGARVGCDAKTVLFYTGAAGITRTRHHYEAANRGGIFAPEEELEICRMYTEDEKNARQIAREVFCSPTTVLRVLHDHQTPMRPQSVRQRGAQPQRWALTPQQLEEARYLHEDCGMSLNELSRRYHCHRTTLAGHLRNAGVVIRRHGSRRRTPFEQIDRVRKLYDSGLSIPQAAEELGWNPHRLRSFMVRYGIERRSLSEANALAWKRRAA